MASTRTNTPTSNIRDRKPGDPVNLEGDILGKYVERHLAARAAATSESESTLSLARLTDEGLTLRARQTPLSQVDRWADLTRGIIGV